MRQSLCTDCPMPGNTASRLASGYDELTRLDLALRDAERRLEAAHRGYAQQPGSGQVAELYLEVLSLRDRVRRVLKELAEIWVADR